jgi:transcription antitermination factor NusG
VDCPLFPGYVFLVGDYDRSALKEARCVVDVLRPAPANMGRLDKDLWTIWRGLVTGSRLELSRRLVPGDVVEIITPPYAGMQGRFERWTTRNRLHVWLDIMGCGAIIELPESDVTRVV